MWTFKQAEKDISLHVNGRILCRDDYLSTLTLVN